MPESASILSEGPFGEAVSRALLKLTPGLRTGSLTLASADEGVVSGAGFLMVALWRLYHNELDRLDERCAEARRPWALAHLDGRFLVLGPVVVPGQGACYRCFRKRYLTHHDTPDRALAVERAWERDELLGVTGHLPSTAWMAAAWLRASMNAESREPGKVLKIDLLHGDVIEGRVIRIHGCPRCGRRAEAENGERFAHPIALRISEIMHG